jgi:hypothetical protein
MNFVILEFSKTKHNLYNNLDYLGLNPYEQRHFCFHGGMGDPGGGEGSEAEGTGGGVDPGGEEESGYDIGFSTAAQQASAAAAAAGMAAGVDAASLADIADVKALQQAGVTLGPYAGVQDYHSGLLDPTAPPDPYPSRKLRRIEEIPRKMYTLPLLQDPIRMLPKMKSLVDRETAADLGKNYLEMLTKAGVEAKAEGREGLVEDIQEELDRGLLADYYQNYDLMNTLENVGFKSFGTGYRGQYEARTGKSVTRDQYDPNTITGAGTGERSATISLYNQFALANPNMTAMEAMAAFNATQSPDAQISAVDLGMLGYDPNAPAGPQAQANEDERYRGFVQGLGLIGKGVALGPVSVAADLALSGRTDEPNSILGILTDELDKQTGIPTAVGDFYDQFKTDLGKARDAVVGAVEENIVDPITGFFSPEPEAAMASPEGYNPAIGMADPAFEGRSGVSYTGSPFSGLPTESFENYQNALREMESPTYGTLESEQRAQEIAEEAYDRTKAELSFDPTTSAMGREAIEAAALDARYDALPAAREQAETQLSMEALSSPEDDALAAAYNFAALSPLSPEQDPDFEKGSFFTGLDPKETQDYIDRVTTPEGVKLVRQRRAQAAPRPPTVSEQVSASRTGNFFPGSFGRPTATPRTRTQTIADIYGFSEEDANRMLGIA